MHVRYVKEGNEGSFGFVNASKQEEDGGGGYGKVLSKGM